MLHTQKVAITMPEILIKEVDALSKKKGLSRSRYITLAVREKIETERRRSITESYDAVFSEDSVRKEQIETAARFEGSGSEGGQEW